jgi:hypothetical protein
MNLKQAKRLRKTLRPLFAHFGMTERSAVHETILVRSRKYNTTVDGVVHNGHALQVRLHKDCPRAQYQRIKHSGLQTIRTG